ncbi:DUF488 domain-containing protein [Arthrobacter sp. C152]
MAGMKALFTVGHGTSSQEEFTALLTAAGVESLVDVRIGPGSRKFPQFGKDSMAGWLPAAGISYRWERRLGGFRKLPPGSPDTALRNESFRAYAAYMRTPDFATAAAELLSGAQDRQTAIMCSETVWWRCHRRLIADHCVLLAGIPVEHLMPPGKRTPHVPTRGVRVLNGGLRYDVPDGQ